MALFVEVSFDGMGGLNVTDVRRERTPMLWSTVRRRALAKGFYFEHDDIRVSAEERSWLEGVYTARKSER